MNRRARDAQGSEYLSGSRLLGMLGTDTLGRCIECYQVIDSTNRRAVEWARTGAPDGALVLAEEQTAGRGRLGRQWHAPAGSALLCSLVLRPSLQPAQAQRATMLCSLAVLDAIRREAGATALVKWPNDVLLSGHKVAGILTELGVEGQVLQYVVVGIGLNVNLDVAVMPETMVPATSLMAEVGAPVSRLALLCRMLEAMEGRYRALAEGWLPHDEWRSHLATLGTWVRVHTGSSVIDGEAIDVDIDGALVVRRADGVEQHVLAGDVTLRGDAR